METDCCAKAGGERRESWRRGRGWMYSTRGGRSQDLRDVTAKIRAIELFNPDGLSPPLLYPASVPFVSYPRFSLPACLPAYLFPVYPTSVPIYSVALEFSVRLVASVPRPASIPLFFRRCVLFLSRLSRPCSGSALSLSSSAIVPACLSGTLALLSRRPCSRAVPLYLPPPSFHHPSKPWSLTGDTDIHTHRYT